MIHSRKMDQKINAKSSIEQELLAKIAKAQAKLDALRALKEQPAYAGAYALAA